MMRWLLGTVALSFLLTCGPPPDVCTCSGTSLDTSVPWHGTLTEADGGVTSVTIDVTASGPATLTFTNAGHTVVEGFTAQ